jgi:hypothetical protein
MLCSEGFGTPLVPSTAGGPTYSSVRGYFCKTSVQVFDAKTNLEELTLLCRCYR